MLIGENLASHLSISVIEACEENNIRFVFLPPNSTHICQPLDVAYFRPLKIKWREVLVEYKTKHKGTVPKFAFPGLLKKALDKMEKSEDNLRSGFRATGIYPLNRSKVLKKLPSDENEVSQDADKSWTDAFVSVLKEARFGNEATTQRRKKRIQVEPGRAVTVDDMKQVSPVNQAAGIKRKKVAKENVDASGKKRSSAKKESSRIGKENINPEPVVLMTTTNTKQLLTAGNKKVLVTLFN